MEHSVITEQNITEQNITEQNITEQNITEQSILNDDEKKRIEEEKREEALKKREEMKIKAYNMSKLKSQIDNLTKSEYIEIFKIIKMNDEKYSQNKNGVMFDLMKFNDKTIEEITNFIKYIENNSLLVEHDEETRNAFRTLLN